MSPRYPARERGNRYAGDPFASLQSAEVVIPDDEPPPPPPPQPEAPPGQAAAGGGAAGGGAAGGAAAALAPLLEETETLRARVDELQRLVGRGAPPAALRAAIDQRLLNLTESLTRHHLAVDAVAVPDEVQRAARRELSRQIEAMCERVDGISLQVRAGAGE